MSLAPQGEIMWVRGEATWTINDFVQRSQSLN